MKKILLVVIFGVIALGSGICDMVFMPKELYEGINGVKVEEIEKVLAPDWSIWMWKEMGKDEDSYKEWTKNGAEITSAVWYDNLIASSIIITEDIDVMIPLSRQNHIRDNEKRGYFQYAGENGGNYYWDIYLNEEKESINVIMLRGIENGGKEYYVYVNLMMNVTRLITLDTDKMIWLRECIWEGESADRYRKSVGELYWHFVDLSRSGAH